MRLNHRRVADSFKPVMTAVDSPPEKCVNVTYNFSWFRNQLGPILGPGGKEQ